MAFERGDVRAGIGGFIHEDAPANPVDAYNLKAAQAEAKMAYSSRYENGCLAQACAPSLLYQLRERKNKSEQEQQRTARAIDILERHPEFEELIELLKLRDQGFFPLY